METTSKTKSLRTGSQSTISELPNLTPVTISDIVMVENQTGTYSTTVGDIINLASGGGVTQEYVDTQDALLQTNIDTNTTNIDTNTTSITGLDTRVTSLEAGGGGTGGDVTKAYVDSHDGLLQTHIDLITQAPLTPDADVLGTEQILSRKVDGTIITINQSALPAGGDGTSDVNKAYVDTQDALLQTNIDTNTTSITGLDTRVTSLESGTGGGTGGFVEPFHIVITSADINSTDSSIEIDLSAHIEEKSFWIDINVLDEKSIFIVNIIGTDALNGFLEEIYLSGNVGSVESSDTKLTSIYIEGVKKADIPARVVHYGIKCRCTINQISDIFYYAKFDENGNHIDAIFANRIAASTSSLTLTKSTDVFFFAFEPVAIIHNDAATPIAELAYVLMHFSYDSEYFQYYLDLSLLILDSHCKAKGNITEKIYAQDNVQDYLMANKRTSYLLPTYFPQQSSDDIMYVYKGLENTALLDANYKSIAGNAPIVLCLYSVTAIGRFNKLLDVRNLPK